MNTVYHDVEDVPSHAQEYLPILPWGTFGARYGILTTIFFSPTENAL
jgi:hypothetical protein